MHSALTKMARSRAGRGAAAFAVVAALAFQVAPGAASDAPSTAAQAPDAAISAAVNAPERTPANRLRDRYRHPQETLEFFGLRPGQTVVELWPGGGWYSEILGSYARANSVTLYAAGPSARGLAGVSGMRERAPELWGHIRLATFPVTTENAAGGVPDGTADLVLTFRNVHNWRFSGTDAAAENFRQIATMLRPGGRLGVVDHRLPESMPDAMEESSGYIKTSTIIRLAEAAGLRLVASSEINANPADTHDWPRGVWTLPPVSDGAAEDPNRDHYLAVGESDRLTLLFEKPR